MNYVVFIYGLFVLSNAFSQVKFLPKSKRYTTQRRSNHGKAHTNHNGTLEKIRSQNSRIEELLGHYSKSPSFVDSTQSFHLNTGSVVRGILLNSIVSSNLQSPVLILNQGDSKLPSSSKFHCLARPQGKRIDVSCERLIVDDNEYEINCLVLNPDGSSGLVGEVYSGDEEYLATTESLNVLSDVAKATVNNLKSPPLLTGAMKALQSVTDHAKSKAQVPSSPIVYVPAGSKVLVYFNRSFIQ